jgi:hypothetical protein
MDWSTMSNQKLALSLDASDGVTIWRADETQQRAPALLLDPPVRLTLLVDDDPYVEIIGSYRSIEFSRDAWNAVAELAAPDGSRFRVTDSWAQIDDRGVGIERSIEVLEVGRAKGFRSHIVAATAFEGGADVRDFDYLAPSVFYRHLDLDGDGVPDTYQSYNLAFSEDKLTAPMALAFAPAAGLSFYIYRRDLPRVDIDVREEVWAGNRFFCAETEVGSIGFRPTDEGQIALVAHCPYYEGTVSYSLDRQGYPWGAFLPMKPGAVLKASYGLRVETALNLADASWKAFRHLLDTYRPEPVMLPYTLDEALRYRIEFLNDFFYAYGPERDPREPAGYIVNQHPYEGKTLGEVFEYGFCGQQALNAYCSLRYGHENGAADFLDHARRTNNFLARQVVRENGFTEQVYSLEKQAFVSWFSGTMLPYSFLTDKDDQIRFLGEKTVATLAPVHAELRKHRGGFTRIMAEEGVGLLMSWSFEKARGVEHLDWLAAAGRIGGLFLKIQNADGSWHRAIDHEGRPMRFPEAWFGRSESMRKSTTCNVVTFMLHLFRATSDERYLRAALAGADFVVKTYVETSYMYGSILDHPMAGPMRASGPVMDNEGPMYTLEALLLAYDVTGEPRWLDAATSAAKIGATWINLWDVPLPKGSVLEKAKFRSVGWSPACMYCGNFQMDMYPLYFLREFVRIGLLTGDEHFLQLAELMQAGMNDMISTPKENYGFAHNGLQAEGRVGAWLFINEWGRPVGEDGANVGGRSKGALTTIAYGWMYAMPLAGQYRLADEYGAIDVAALRRALGRRG